METNLHCCTRIGRTALEKIMEDGNIAHTNDEKIVSSSLTNLYTDKPAKLTTNGHVFAGESSSLPPETYEQYRPSSDVAHDDRNRKRINPLRIHLGKRPYVDTSPPYYNHSQVNKKRKPFVVKSSDTSTPIVPRVPKLSLKHKFHNVASQPSSYALEDEQDKPVPRLVPKSQLLQFKQGKAEKINAKESPQPLVSQPMVKFKCRKCYAMSFKTLALLKEHQLICRAQSQPSKEPTPTPEAAPSIEQTTSGPSRVTRKVYLCSACGTYYENWNLFLHMREAHNRHICLFCLGMFSKAEKLSSHLINKHNVKEFNYDSKEDFFNVYEGTFYVMCCVCDEIYSEQDDFYNHDCNKVKPRPVPVLVSKMGVKPKNMKAKVCSERSINHPTSISREPPKTFSDKKDTSEVKIDAPLPPVPQTVRIPISSDCEPVTSDTSVYTEHSNTSNKDTNTSNTLDSGMELGSSKSDPSPVQPVPTLEKCHSVPNGDESVDQSDDYESPVPSPEAEAPFTAEKPVVPVYTPRIDKEREGGIKLKLSLNNANSPVIINSTVDPSIGLQSQYKPPTRARRPPKRYEKETPSETHSQPSTPQSMPRTPTIKMTICDKADNSFVKTTIYENNPETTLRTLLNNNLENISKPQELKADTSIKSTIYDNKMDDDNSLNRVPKLTVRVPKELLDKDSSSDYSSDSDVSDKLTMDENNATIAENDDLFEEEPAQEPKTKPEILSPEKVEGPEPSDQLMEEELKVTDDPVSTQPQPEAEDENLEEEINVDSKVDEPIVDEIPVIELTLNKPLDKYPLKDLLKVFLSSTIYNCIYCNHARKIAVNCEHLSLHMAAEHRFKATVDSITAEELMPQTIAARVRARAEEAKTVYINLNSYDSEEKYEELQYDNLFECFQCYFKTPVHKDLYLHNRKMHQKTILLCVMCKSNFYSYSELLCHLCPGTYDSEYEIRFRCYLCNIDTIPSSFRLMVHLRKSHHTCDVCLEFCHNQARLSNHVWKHKLHHLCFRCGIAYRNKPDITNHLFWKHGTESVLCKRCLQKKWPHVFHFCTPPAIFMCEECNLQFTKAVYLKVHKRFHSGELPHECTEEGCTEKFVSKKLLLKHIEEHTRKLLMAEMSEEKLTPSETVSEVQKEPIAIIDLVDDKPSTNNEDDTKTEAGTEQTSKKAKKKKLKDKDALLLDVNLPELNLSESDSSDESDSGEVTKKEQPDVKPEEMPDVSEVKDEKVEPLDIDAPKSEIEAKEEPVQDEKPDEKQVLEIWDNFKKYQEKIEKPKEKEKTPPLVPIRKHVCESDHDYCLIPADMNGDEDMFSLDKKKSKKSPKKKHGGLSSSSSSSSDSDSSCSCGSNCSCSSSSGSSSSSSSDSDSSDDSGNGKKKSKQLKKKLPNRRLSNGSNVDVMGVSETPVLVPEKVEPPVAETDLETNESETDEEFYDENPQRIANKLYEEKKNQLMLLASVAPSDGGSMSGASRPPSPSLAHTTTVSTTEPVKEINETVKEKPSSSKKKSKKKKKSKSSKKHGPIKINIPKEVISKSDVTIANIPLAPNKITISLQSNTVHIPETSSAAVSTTNMSAPLSNTPMGNKRASKRRRIPNKFYGYSSDDDSSQTNAALKPQQPPKLEWRKEDLPSPVTHKAKKEIPTTILTNKLYNSYSDSIRLTAPIPDPEPPRILMNTESVESSDSDSSDEGGLEIYQPSHNPVPIPPPSYLNSGTSSLPYPFQRPAVRQAREGESVYCYCRCPYDEVSEMIACDAEGCPIEWFHFECVGIMVPPKGKWYCPECRKNQSFSGYR